MVTYSTLIFSLCFFVTVLPAECRHADNDRDVVQPVGGTLTRSRDRVNSGPPSLYEERNEGEHEKPRLATVRGKTTQRNNIHDAFSDGCSECTNKIPSPSGFCQKNYEFGIEVHVVHKHRSGYAVKVSRIYRNRVYHTEELVSSRDIIDVDFIVPTSPNTVNKQLLSCRCPLLRANHTYALFGYVKSRQSKHFLLTLNVVLEIPHDSMNRRQMRRALKKLAATNCPGSSSTPTVVTATEPGHRLETVVGHKSSPRQKYIIHHS